MKPPTDLRTPLTFSARQQSIITAGITAFCATLVVAFCVVLIGSLCSFVSAVSVVLTPLITAMILAVIFKPYYQWLYDHLFRKHGLALPIFFLTVSLPAILVLSFFGALLLKQLLALNEYLPLLAERITTYLSQENPTLLSFLSKMGVTEKLPALLNPEAIIASLVQQMSLSQVGGTALSYSLSAARYLVSLVGWLIVPIYLIYFLMAQPFTGERAENFMPFFKPDTRHDIAYLINEFFKIIASFFRGQILVATLQGILFGLGFWMVGLPYGLVIGLCLGCLNLIPYLGNMVGLSITLPMAFLGEGGSLTRLVLVMAVFMIVQTLDGYFITPRIQGKRTGLNDVTIIFSILFWGVVFKGMLGVLLAIPLSAFVVVFWRLLKRKYIKELL